MGITTILWDIDNTLLDFQAAEGVAIQNCFHHFGFGTCTEEMLSRYSIINQGYWKKLELGEMEKAEILVKRYEDFFLEYGLPADRAAEFNEAYQKRLGDTCIFMDDAKNLILQLKERGYRQYAATNGTLIAQERKLRNSGLDQLLDGAFISDQIGHEKPTDGFFNHVFEALPHIPKEEMIIIGDSLSSDIKGGKDHGIYSIWYNPRGLENQTEVHPDQVIRNLWEVEGILSLG